jgi:hypothetical protein
MMARRCGSCELLLGFLRRIDVRLKQASALIDGRPHRAQAIIDDLRRDLAEIQRAAGSDDPDQAGCGGKHDAKAR